MSAPDASSRGASAPGPVGFGADRRRSSSSGSRGRGFGGRGRGSSRGGAGDRGGFGAMNPSFARGRGFGGGRGRGGGDRGGRDDGGRGRGGDRGGRGGRGGDRGGRGGDRGGRDRRGPRPPRDGPAPAKDEKPRVRFEGDAGADDGAAAEQQKQQHSRFFTLREQMPDAGSVAEMIAKSRDATSLTDSKMLSTMLQVILSRRDADFHAAFFGAPQPIAAAEGEEAPAAPADYRGHVWTILALLRSWQPSFPWNPAAHEFVLRCEAAGAHRSKWLEGPGPVKPLDDKWEAPLLTPKELLLELRLRDPVGRLARRIELATTSKDVVRCCRDLVDAGVALAAEAAEDADEEEAADLAAARLSRSQRTHALMKLLSKLHRMPADAVDHAATAAVVAACSSVLNGNAEDAGAAAPMDVAKKIRLSLQWLGARPGAVEEGSATAADLKRLAGDAEAPDGDADDDEVATARKAAQLSAVLQLKVAKSLDDVEAVLGLIVETGDDGVERFQAGVGSVDVISALAVAIQTFVAPPPQAGKEGAAPIAAPPENAEEAAEAEAEDSAAVAAIAADVAALDDADDVAAAAARIVARSAAVARPNAGKNNKKMQLVPGGGAPAAAPAAPAAAAPKAQLERTPQGIAIEERAYRLFVQEAAAGRGLPRRAGGFIGRLHSLYRRRQREE